MAYGYYNGSPLLICLLVEKSEYFFNDKLTVPGVWHDRPWFYHDVISHGRFEYHPLVRLISNGLLLFHKSLHSCRPKCYGRRALNSVRDRGGRKCMYLADSLIALGILFPLPMGY